MIKLGEKNMTIATVLAKFTDTCECGYNFICNHIYDINYPSSFDELPEWASKYNSINLFDIIGNDSNAERLMFLGRNALGFYLGHRFITARIVREKMQRDKMYFVREGDKIPLNPAQWLDKDRFPYHVTRLKIVTEVPILTVKESSESISGFGYSGNNFSYIQLKAGEIYSMYEINHKLNKYFLVYHSSAKGLEIYLLNSNQVIKLYML